MDRVTNISWRTTSGARIGGFEYEYDAAGRIVSRSRALGVGDRLVSYNSNYGCGKPASALQQGRGHPGHIGSGRAGVPSPAAVADGTATLPAGECF
ncbi:MAG: hypothetical protein E7049_09520 [Lentisphaerae bacterium]|nr:hypothetical protein [Lentisphaerota bacterium]